MRKNGIEKLVERIAHAAQIARTKSGPGSKWTAKLSDGRSQNYEVTNIRDIATLEHDVATWCVWIWSLKDYIQTEAASRGYPSSWWKGVVRESHALKICADLANTEKHGLPLREPWTPFLPRLEAARMTIHQDALRAIIFSADKIVIDTVDPNLAEIEVPVVDLEGNTIGDALHLLAQAMDAWDTAMLELRGAI